jgi:DNA ligase-associated metallophosphoesterase
MTAADPLVGSASLDCGGERLHLLPERAVWWPAARILLVADVHLGKAATFRALGQPVPGGTTAANLRRIEALVDRLGVLRLVVLGDFVHAREALRPSLIAAIAGWRGRQPGLRCTVVEGNHDRRAGALPAGLDIESAPDPLFLRPFVLTHGDRQPGVPEAGYHLAGHLHPAYVLRGRAGERLRLPCFLFGPAGAILPAFGEFTGQADVMPGADDRVFVVGDGQVWAVPPVAGPG